MATWTYNKLNLISEILSEIADSADIVTTTYNKVKSDFERANQTYRQQFNLFKANNRTVTYRDEGNLLKFWNTSKPLDYNDDSMTIPQVAGNMDIPTDAIVTKQKELNDFLTDRLPSNFEETLVSLHKELCKLESLTSSIKRIKQLKNSVFRNPVYTKAPNVEFEIAFTLSGIADIYHEIKEITSNTEEQA